MGRCASRLCPCVNSASYGKYEFFAINGRSHGKSHDSKDNYSKTNGATNNADVSKSARNNADVSKSAGNNADVSKNHNDVSNDVSKSAAKDYDVSKSGDAFDCVISVCCN